VTTEHNAGPLHYPEALRLADALEASVVYGYDDTAAAAELRRLHAVNAELLEALRLFVGDNRTHTEGERLAVARAAIAKAEEVKP
jgi:hypothetical protein